MPKGDVLPLWFFLSFFLLSFFSFFLLTYFFFRPRRSEVTGTDLNQTWTHMHLWLVFEEFGPKSFGRLPSTGWGGGKNPLFRTDFELWSKISLQRNMTSTIGKKAVYLQGLPYIPPPKVGDLWSTNGWERLTSFCPPLKFTRRTSCRLTFATHFGLIIFARWRLWPTQTPRAWLALVRLRAGQAHAGLCHASRCLYFTCCFSLMNW